MKYIEISDERRQDQPSGKTKPSFEASRSRNRPSRQMPRPVSGRQEKTLQFILRTETGMIPSNYLALFAILAAPMLASTASAQQWNAKCAVFRGDRLVEAKPCRRMIIRQGAAEEGGGSTIVRYRWKSGGSTITENVEEDFKINGRQGRTIMAKPGYDLCVKNLTSGNSFCTRF
jgi:hypothetical protein